MATHYKGEQINALLDEIETLRRVLEDNQIFENDLEMNAWAWGYSKLVVAKAKLTALKGKPLPK